MEVEHEEAGLGPPDRVLTVRARNVSRVTYKLLAVDLDGTLLRPDGTIHEKDVASIAKLREAGIPTTIVTGRLFSGSIEAARRAGITGPIGCVDGSHVVDVESGAEHVHHSLAGYRAERLRMVLSCLDGASFVFAGDRIVHDAAGAPLLPYVRTWSTRLDAVERVTEDAVWSHERGVLGAVAVGSATEIRRAVEAIEADLPSEAFVLSFPVHRRPGEAALIVRAFGATKGTALGLIAAKHGCTEAEVVAVGDWLNDVPMFAVAGRSFAMRQAPDAVKAVATDCLEADGTKGGGVAEAVARAFPQIALR